MVILSVMKKDYIKLIKKTEKEQRGYFKRARQIVDAFGADVPFPTDTQLRDYRTQGRTRLDATLEYLCDAYVIQQQLNTKKGMPYERYEKR